MEVDFGCILNDTEVTRYVNITNNSPLEVSYRWSFMLDDEPVAVFRKSVQVQKKSLDLESRDLESRQAEDEGKEIYDVTEERLKEAEAVEELDVAIEAGSPRNATQSPQQDRLLVSSVLFRICRLVFMQRYVVFRLGYRHMHAHTGCDARTHKKTKQKKLSIVSKFRYAQLC